MPAEGTLPKLDSRFRRFLDELDRREGYVPGHSAAVGKTSLALARALGLPEGELPAITLGALMHDIGKVFVDGRLLGKPGPLGRDELEAVRLHPQLGEALLAPTVSHATVLGIVRWHHERWDGGGYPDELAGERIPLAARIAAVADAFTAMCESRAYRRARTLDQALGELERLAGRQFDRGCVEALVDSLGGARRVA